MARFAVRTPVNKRRKGWLAMALPWLRRFGAVLAVCVFVVWLAAWVWLSGAVVHARDYVWAALVDWSVQGGIVIQDVVIDGRVNANEADIRKALAPPMGQSLLAFETAAARTRIEQVTWVSQARIERRLPHTLYVSVQEFVPLARWARPDGKTVLIDTNGKIIAGADPAPFTQLPGLTGAGADTKAPDLFAMLDKQPDLRTRLDSARWVDQRRWDLVFMHRGARGPIVQMPEMDLPAALGRLALAQREKAILDQGFISIDLRQEEQMIIKPSQAGSVNPQSQRAPDTPTSHAQQAV